MKHPDDGKLDLKLDVIPPDKNVIEPFKPNRYMRRKHKATTTQRTHKHNEKARLAIYCKIIAGELK